MTPPITSPGRDVWTTRGGTTPYYELTTAPTPNVGSTPDVDFWHTAVTYGVKAIQHRINELGFSPKLEEDGWFGKGTRAGALWVQTKLGFIGTAVDGVIGPNTAKRLFVPVGVDVQKKYGIPGNLLLGGIDLESAWDPGAQGAGTPYDLGFEQRNTQVYVDVTPDLAFDYHWALNDFGVEFIGRYRRYVPNTAHAWQTEDLRRRCAVGGHFAPAWADKWWATGVAPLPRDYADKSPDEQKKIVTIEKYANAVLGRANQF